MILNNLTLRRKILYISLIIFILIIISVILKIVLSEAGKEKNVSEQEVVKCHELDETECLEHNSCRPYYGPSHPMTNDIVFKGCFPFPLKDRLESITEKIKCLSSGNDWNDDHYYYPGICEK